MSNTHFKIADNFKSELADSKNKIRNKLLAVFLLVSILPILLIGIYVLIFTTETIKDTSLSIHTAKIDLVSEKIHNYLDQVNSDIFYLRDSNALNLYLSSLESESAMTKQLMLTNLRTSFKKFTSKKRNYLQVRFINTEGLEIVGIDYDGKQARHVSDTDLQDQSNASYFQNAIVLNKDELFITALNLNQVGSILVKKSQPTINYATPVFNEVGMLVGILTLNVDMRRIMRIVSSETKGGTQIQFVNPDGYYFYSNDTKSKNKDTVKSSKLNLFSENRPLSEAIKKAPASGSIAIAGQIVTYKVININNDKFNLGTILDITPEHIVYAAGNDFLYIFIGVVLLTLSLAFILALVLSNSITQPVIALTDDVDRLSKGDLETPIAFSQSDEIGKLAIAIERLRKSMKILMKRAA